MAFGSRKKGAVAEREVAQLIKLWWNKLEPNAEFVRTPLSGGWGNAKLRGEFKASGDLMTTAQNFPFTVEVKRREFPSHRVAPGTLQRSPVWGWWEQTIKAAKEQGGLPLLIFRGSREPWRFLLPCTRTYWKRLNCARSSGYSPGVMAREGERVILSELDLLRATDPRYWSL